MKLIDEVFKALAQNAGAFSFLEPLKAEMLKHGIDTKLRVSHFLAQCAHESAGFTVLTENLNYSADGLARVWPNRFRGKDGKPNALALSLHRKPEQIANSVYANRLGNGGPESGHGWKYRGQGLIQLTGLSNIKSASMDIYGDLRLVDDPTLLQKPEGASKSAVWFWTKGNINSLADLNDVPKVTRAVNGGLVGLPHRAELTKKAIDVAEGVKDV